MLAQRDELRAHVDYLTGESEEEGELEGERESERESEGAAESEG